MTMMQAPAKINWHLKVLGKRSDDYHELDTLMQTVSLYDELRFSRSARWSIDCGGANLPADERNLALRAAVRYAQAASLPDAYHICLQKRIPIEAGLGGGSSDAAAVLRFLQREHRALDERTLWILARDLGADVPFFLHGKLARCRGIGEKLTPLAGKRHPLLLVKPERGVNTRALFASLSKYRYQKDAAYLHNDLLPAAAVQVSEIPQILAALKRVGAKAAGLSGSGSCCFGVFGDESEARRVRVHFSQYAFTYVCHTLA